MQKQQNEYCLPFNLNVSFNILEPSSLPVVVAQPDERHANRTASVLK